MRSQPNQCPLRSFLSFNPNDAACNAASTETCDTLDKTVIYLNTAGSTGKSLFKIEKQKLAPSNCIFWTIKAFTHPSDSTTEPYNCVNGNYFLDWSDMNTGNWKNQIRLAWRGAGTTFCPTSRWALFATDINKWIDNTI